MKHTLLAIAVGAVLALPPAAPVLAADSPAMPASGSQTQTQAARGYLGVTIGRLPSPVRAQLPGSVPREQGLLVEQVMEDSPAAKAGLQPFDILLGFNDQKLFSPDQFVQLVGSGSSGQAAKLTIVRGGQISTLNVTLGEKPEPEPMSRLSRLESYPLHAMHRHPTVGPGQQARQDNEEVWESFDSLSLDKIGDDKYKAVIGYLNEDGKHERLEFQGSRDEIRQQIRARKDLPVTERDQLMEALSARDDSLPFDPRAIGALERELFAPPGRWGWYPNY